MMPAPATKAPHAVPDSPNTRCPACGAAAPGATVHTRNGTRLAYYLCDNEHLFEVRWVAADEVGR